MRINVHKGSRWTIERKKWIELRNYQDLVLSYVSKEWFYRINKFMNTCNSFLLEKRYLILKERSGFFFKGEYWSYKKLSTCNGLKYCLGWFSFNSQYSDFYLLVLINKETLNVLRKLLSCVMWFSYTFLKLNKFLMFCKHRLDLKMKHRRIRI